MITDKKRERHQRIFQPLEKGEGAYLAITSPINDSGKVPFELPPPNSVEERWLSTEYRVQCAEAAAQNIYWGQDAIQSEFVNMGPGVHAAYVGAPYEADLDSIWFDMHPIINDWDNPPALKIDKNHVLYKAVEDQTRALCAASQGRYAVAHTDLGGQLDVLFSLRGEDMLADFIEYPEKIMAAENILNEDHIKCFNDLSDIIKPTGCGYSTWIPIVNNVPYQSIQSDVSVMVSPKMFEKFILPSISKVAAAIGYNIYHLDGPEQIQHLDMLLSVEQIQAIQWVPLPQGHGTGDAFFQDFADEMSIKLYKRCLAAGKKVVLSSYVAPNQLKTIFDAVGCDGMFVKSHCKTRKEADELIAYAQKEWLVL